MRELRPPNAAYREVNGHKPVEMQSGQNTEEGVRKTGYILLAAAIVMQAVQDYQDAKAEIATAKHKRTVTTAQRKIEEITEFFHSNEPENLTGIPGNKFLDSIDTLVVPEDFAIGDWFMKDAEED